MGQTISSIKHQGEINALQARCFEEIVLNQTMTLEEKIARYKAVRERIDQIIGPKDELDKRVDQAVGMLIFNKP